MKNNEELVKYLSELLPEAEVSLGKQYPEIVVTAEKWHDTVSMLFQNSDKKFDFLISLTAVDYNPKFTVVAHIEATSTHELIVLKADVDNRENPTIDTLSDIYPTVEYHEREVFDLYGIHFNNHPDLRRLFLEDDYGFPLRKDFKDDINIIELPN